MGKLKTNSSQYLRGIREILSIIWAADKKLTLLLVVNNLLRNVSRPIQALAIRGVVNCITTSITSGFTPEIQGSMYSWLALLFIPFAANRVWWPLNSYAQSLMLAQISNEIKSRIMAVVQSASLSFFDISENYDLLKNACEESTSRRPINVVNNILNCATTVISLAIIFIPMIILNPLLTLMLAASSIPGIILENRYGKLSWQLERNTALQKRKIDYAFNLFTSKKTAKELKQFGISEYIAKKHAKELACYQRSFISLYKRKFALDLPVWFITQAALITGYYIIIVMTAKADISFGDMAFFINVVGQIQGAVESVGSAYNNTADSSRFMNNILRLFDNPNVDPIAERNIGDTVLLNIEFRNVSFRYPQASEYTLKNVSFKLSLPEHVAIVGLNGSGKTTLIKLLLRFYDPQEGEVLVNGINIKELDIKAWRKLFSVCFQDTFNYGFTLRESIGLSRLEASEKEIVSVMQKAGLSGVVDKLPKGMDTCLSKEFDTEAIELSGGQYSRVAIARAFLGTGQVIILDEPSASLDAKAERELFNLFEELEKDRLGIMITHRLSNTVTADKILVLDSGSLIECGNHEDLMKRKGVYYTLFEMQASAYRTEVAV